MTETDWEALGRRAVACKGWRWVPGMLAALPDPTGGTLWERYTEGDGPWRPSLRSADVWPDLRDPATLGCLVALVREAWGEPGVFAARAGDCAWIVSHDRWKHRQHAAGGATEAEAWVAALEAAP